MSITNWKGNWFAILAYGMLAIGIILIIYDQVTLEISGYWHLMIFAHATLISIIGLILGLAGLVLLQELK